MTTLEPKASGVSSLEQFVWQPLREIWQSIVDHAPAVVTSIVVLIALWIVARIVRAAISRIFGVTKLDKSLEKTRMARMLTAFKEGLTPSAAFAHLVYFALMLVAWMAAADIVGLTAVRNTLEAVLAYLPNLISALLVVTLGGYLAGLARRTVSAALGEVRSPYARMLEGLTEFILLVVVLTIAVNVLGADVSLITSNLTILIATFAVTIAFLFAWSMRRPAEEIIANYYVRRTLRTGDSVAIGEIKGTIRAFKPLGLMIEDASGVEHFVRAQAVLGGVTRTARASLPEKSA